MSHENSTTKKNISIQEFGDLSTDCSLAATSSSIFAFFLGGIGVRVSLGYLDRLLRTRTEIKLLASLSGALCISIYTAKTLRDNCEKKLNEEYHASRLIK